MRIYVARRNTTKRTNRRMADGQYKSRYLYIARQYIHLQERYLRDTDRSSVRRYPGQYGYSATSIYIKHTHTHGRQFSKRVNLSHFPLTLTLSTMRLLHIRDVVHSNVHPTTNSLFHPSIYFSVYCNLRPIGAVSMHDQRPRDHISPLRAFYTSVIRFSTASETENGCRENQIIHTHEKTAQRMIPSGRILV